MSWCIIPEAVAAALIAAGWVVVLPTPTYPVTVYSYREKAPPEAEAVGHLGHEYRIAMYVSNGCARAIVPVVPRPDAEL